MEMINIHVLFDLPNSDQPIAHSLQIPMPALVQTPQRTCDPVADLLSTSGAIVIKYGARFMKSNTIAFMDFAKADRRWLDILLVDLQYLHTKSCEDFNIMHSIAPVRNRQGKSQTWQTFINDLCEDKVATGMDFTSGQLRHLPALLTEVAKGRSMAGCGTIKFQAAQTTKPN